MDRDIGATELAVMAAFDRAAELRRHHLLAVADAQHRHAAIEDDLRRARAAVVRHAGGGAGQDDGFRVQPRKGVVGFVEGHDFAKHPRLAHATGDELRDLRAEIDDENRLVGGFDALFQGSGGRCMFHAPS